MKQYWDILNVFSWNITCYFFFSNNAGYNKYGDLCKSNGASCQEMERTFFLQYQWFPIGVAALAFLYYLPYLLFRLANADMQGLKGLIAGKTVPDVDFEKVIQNYFSRRSRSTSNQTIRVLLNILVKILYIVANIAGFIVIDSAINKEFIKYGGRWSNWLGVYTSHWNVLLTFKRHRY